MITGSVELDFSSETRDQRGLGELPAIPDGARVVVRVGSRPFVPMRTRAFLQLHAERLDLDIQGDLDAVKIWVRSLRGDVTDLGVVS